ncbi:hypothetical protein GCM10009851_11380 [Herbiconiux moechotypicola]|uniref:Uncharacterized protein n=1 Tax=Herbiconiux moechotypicola TaxID=637393 RepID=A0ABN3DE49_9MICO
MLGGLADEGAVLSTRRIGLMAGPMLFSRSPHAPARWATTFGAVIEPYLSDTDIVAGTPLELAVSTRTRLLLLARYERTAGLVFARGDGGAAHPESATLDRASAASIRTLRGRLLLGTPRGAPPTTVSELRPVAQRLQRALARNYPLVCGRTEVPDSESLTTLA